MQCNAKHDGKSCHEMTFHSEDKKKKEGKKERKKRKERRKDKEREKEEVMQERKTGRKKVSISRRRRAPKRKINN